MNGVSVHGRSSSATYMPNCSSPMSTCLRCMDGQVYPSLLHCVAGHVIDYLRTLTPAPFVRVRAAGMERAARRWCQRIWNLPCNRRARLAANGEVGHGIEQHTGVRMSRPRKKTHCRAELDDPAEIHDPDAVGDV